MPNHFHLLVRSPRATLSRAMKHLLGVYTQRVNAANHWDGPVFRGRFRSQGIHHDDYLRYVMAYIHLNPVRAHLVQRPDAPCWTSYRAHLGLEGLPDWLNTDGVTTWFGSARAMGEWTRRLQIGREMWPPEIALDHDARIATKSAAKTRAPSASRALDAAALLQRIAAVTGAPLESLRENKRGRGANAARRFAVRVLLDVGRLSHAEIAAALGMSIKAVANRVQKDRVALESAELKRWKAAFAASTPSTMGADDPSGTAAPAPGDAKKDPR